MANMYVSKKRTLIIFGQHVCVGMSVFVIVHNCLLVNGHMFLGV